MDILELIRAGLLEPGPELPQSDEDLAAEWSGYELAPSSGATTFDEDGLRRDLLSEIARRSFPLGVSNPTPEAILPFARAAYEREVARRGLEAAFGDDGRIASYPPIEFANPMQREIARRVYREGGAGALAELDPGYGPYREFVGSPGNVGYQGDFGSDGNDAHLLPPGYADLLGRERDYELLRMMRDSDERLTVPRMQAALKGSVPFARQTNLSPAEYYPRYYDQGLSNAFSSGEDAPVASGFQLLETLPNGFRYTADEVNRTRPAPTGIGITGVGGETMGEGLYRMGEAGIRGLIRAARNVPRMLDNQASGRDVPMGDVPVGADSSESVSELTDERQASFPPGGTDLAQNLVGHLGRSPFVGDVADFGVSTLDGTQFLGGGLSNFALSSLRNDALIDVGANAALSQAIPGADRTWGEYFFDLVPERTQEEREMVASFADADDEPRMFGKPSEARALVRETPADGLKDLYKASPERASEQLERMRRRKAESRPSYPASMGGF